MTDKQINETIATLCGWTFHDVKYAHVGGGEVFEKFWLPPGIDIKTLTAEDICSGPNHGRSVPNYCGDLNAMHEAEKHRNTHWGDYLELIYKIDCPYEGVRKERIVCEAEARVRAEAWLRMFDKWN